MDVQEDEAYHSGHYLQTAEQLETAISEKRGQSASRSALESLTGTKGEQNRPTSAVSGKGGTHKSLGMQEAGETSRRKAVKAVTPQGLPADTPTTSLAKGLASFNLKSRGSQSKQPSVDSPLSDYGYASGNFPSIPDGGYDSMPSIHDKSEPPASSETVKKPTPTPTPVSSAGAPTRITRLDSESMDVDVVGTPTEDKEQVMPKPPPPNVAITPHPSTGKPTVTITLLSSGEPHPQLPLPLRSQQRSVGVAFDPQKAMTSSAAAIMTGANELKEKRERLSASPTKHRKSKSPSPSPGSSSLSASPSHARRSESPKSIPSVGENVEIFTDVGMGVANDDDIVNNARPEGATMKRMASAGAEMMAELYGRASKKTARLDDDRSTAASKKAIRVPTIVSPAGSGRQSPMTRGKSPQSRDARSPVSINIFGEAAAAAITGAQRESIERVFVTGLTPVLAQQLQLQLLKLQQQPKVNFKDIGDISKSSRDTQQLSSDRSVSPREGWKDPSSGKTVERGGSMADRLSPQPARSPLPISSPMAVANLISAKGASPHHVSTPSRSPSHSPHPPKDGEPSDRARNVASRGGASGEERGTGAEGKPGPRNALLQVSEAHLAILPDEDGDTPLHLAIIHENLGLTQYLVKLIVGVYMNLDIANNMRQTPLHLAVITRQPQMVQLLVDAGASVNFPDRKGNTALHLASARRDTRILQILSRATSPLPDFNCKNFGGLTPAHVATKEASIDVLKFLFQMGANKNAPDACSGRTPLHYAVEQENFILVNYLLESNCSVNVATFAGNTPLHIAAGRRLKEIVALLMAYGANPAIANGEGDFPSDLPASLLMQRAKMNAH